MGLTDRVPAAEREKAAGIEAAAKRVRVALTDHVAELAAIERMMLLHRLELQCDVLMEAEDVRGVLEEIEAAAADLRRAVDA